MPQNRFSRPWRVVAQELTLETNPARVTKLSQELNYALEQEELQNRSRRTNDAACSAKSGSQAKNYETIVDQAVAVMGADYASVQKLAPGRGPSGELRMLAFRGFNPEAARFWKWVRADSKSTCGIALREMKRVIAPEIAGCEFMTGSEDQRVYLQTGIRACQTTPLIDHDGNVVGMISTHWRLPHQPSEKEFRAFDALAREAAQMMEGCEDDSDRR